MAILLPKDAHKKQTRPLPFTSQQYVESKDMDLWCDKIFVKHLIKAIQDVDDEIGAILYPETKIIVFLWKEIIIHKILLDAYNQDTLKIKDHVEQVKNRLSALTLGIIPISTLQNVRRQAKKLNFKRGQDLTR